MAFSVKGFIPMIPGEMFIKDGDVELNKGRKSVTLSVANSGVQADPGRLALSFSSRPTRR